MKNFELWLNQGHTVIPNLLLANYPKLGLNDTELIFVIQLQSYLDQSLYFPNMADIAKNMSKTESEIFNLLHSLIQKKNISIQTAKDESGKVSDRYTLTPLYKKLAMLLEKETDQENNSDKNINLLEVFQQEFGRLLTPIEMQMIGEWLDRDRYSKEIIIEALREAVLNQKYSLKYIDRILLSWEKKNIRTPNSAKEETKRFARQQTSYQTVENEEDDEEDIPLFNWLDPKGEN